MLLRALPLKSGGGGRLWLSGGAKLQKAQRARTYYTVEMETNCSLGALRPYPGGQLHPMCTCVEAAGRYLEA